jgi:sigma-B regulation protein RsbU (phosphoserine phosphatase)
MKTAILRGLPMFAALPTAELAALVEISSERAFQPGEVLLTESGFSEHFYILMDGEVEILKSMGTSDERRVALCRVGTLLGEMSMFSATGMHTASARAITTTNAMVITRAHFNNLLHSRPEIAVELVGVLSRRLEESENGTIRDLREKNRELTLAYDELKAAQAQLIEKEMLERELEIASNLQLSILPHAAPRYPHYDIGALMIPARMIGGDFYDFIPLGPDRLGVVVGDVCDKGIPAALFMTLTYMTMREEAQRNPDPGDALRAVNRRIIEINASQMFVTLLYGVLDFTRHEFHYARAGHPRPMLLASGLPPLLRSLRPGQPVGLFDPLVLDEQCLPVPVGSTLLLFSDGLSESLEQLGVPDLGALCTSFLDAPNLTAKDYCRRLWEKVSQDGVEVSRQDDFTVLAIRAV